jgi:hypothetical protein
MTRFGVLEMLMDVRMFLTVLFATNGGGFAVRRTEIRFPGGFRTHCAQRNQLLQVVCPARRAFGGWRRMQHKVFKPVSTLPALVFVDGHEESLYKWRLGHHRHSLYR